MYYSVRGEVIYKDHSTVAVECGGVGYKLKVSMSTSMQVGKVGEEVKLFTHLSVRDDALELFGFATETELSSFQMLIGISGVGPKAALAILSDLTPEEFALAVAAGDYKKLTKAQGIGPKIAQRVVLELKDKLKGFESTEQDYSFAGTSVGGVKNTKSEALDALMVLGYQKSDAAAAIAKFEDGTTLEDLIRGCLKILAGQG